MSKGTEVISYINATIIAKPNTLPEDWETDDKSVVEEWLRANQIVLAKLPDGKYVPFEG